MYNVNGNIKQHWGYYIKIRLINIIRQPIKQASEQRQANSSADEAFIKQFNLLRQASTTFMLNVSILISVYLLSYFIALFLTVYYIIICLDIYQQQMKNYENMRTIKQSTYSPFNLRPSGWLRIAKYALQFSLIQSLFLYGAKFNGVGILSNYIEKAKPLATPLISRLGVLSTNVIKGVFVAVPYFLMKQVVYGSIQHLTINKPKMRRLLDYSFVNSIIAIPLTLPLLLMLNKNGMKALRSGLAICLFSQLNDVYIQRTRQAYIHKWQKPATHQSTFNTNITSLQQDMLSEGRTQQSEQTNWKEIKHTFNSHFMFSNQQELDKYRQQQISDATNSFNLFFDSIKQVFVRQK